ncbi:MAG: helix-turn-helix domain-containing protein [Lachnospiraceae bacterium]|nr:helix-turn-helix domain-containing protein [Lachnospiraceae bacterium]
MFLDFDSENGFEYRWCGKFTPPHDEWVHLTRHLMDYELMVVTEGTLFIADHNQEYIVNKGEYLLMPPTPHQYGTRPGSCEFYWLHFDYHEGLQDHLSLPVMPEYLSGHLRILVHGTLSSIERIIILMKQLQDSDRRYKENTLNNALCSAILAELSAQNRYTNTSEKQLKEQLYNDILDYISWHAQDNLRVSEIAYYFGYNEKYLTTFFKKYSGITLKQHILQTKMELAKSALSETNHSISQIAYSLGFSDGHNFSNAFHKVTGLSPSEYRASYNKHNVFQK